jgi:4'-phosphopantetheinyl transferase
MKVCFNTIEIEAIKNSVDSLKSFYKFWTRKEAILKATGQGIATNLLAINVLEGERTLFLEQWQAPRMYLNTYSFQSDYIISIGSELGLVPLQFVLK